MRWFFFLFLPVALKPLFICVRNRKVMENRNLIHLMTLTARARRLGGIARPICVAVFELIVKSNFIGCSLFMLLPYREPAFRSHFRVRHRKP